MLHLKFALNLEHLADKMIEEISSVWNNPFEAPIVIFPDFKLEQWFRLKWIKKNGVLANLNRMTIDSFMFKILAGEHAKKTGKLQSDMLANVISAYLIKQETKDGPHNYETIDESGHVKRYLEKDGILDAGKLYDFANTMAGLFLDYETSRPENFLLNDQGKIAKGILDCWEQGNLTDFFVKRTKDGTPVVDVNEAWERSLYSKIFHNVGKNNSLLTQVFEKADPDHDSKNKFRYLTLPFLYKECLNSNGEPQFKYMPNQPIYILGLSGMGQFYRIVLREYAKKKDVYAYIQNPCMEFWEDVDTSRRKVPPKILPTEYGKRIDAIDEEDMNQENPLLRNWGKAGRDNIKLWCLSDDYSSCDFPEKGSPSLLDKSNEKTEQKTDLLHTIQSLVASRKSGLDLELKPEQFENDSSLTITAAPSKLREVEVLHTAICKLIHSKKARFSDILVVSPNLQEYCPAIYQIFDQAKLASQKETDSEERPIVHVPYNIIDSVKKESAIEQVLRILFQIRSTKNISRQDFFDLVRNHVVQSVRGIDNDTVLTWEKWIVDMCIYRDQDKDFDWYSGIDRMLLARLSTNSVMIDEKECRPYADIASSNDSLLLNFISTIEALKRWTTDFDNDGLKENSLQTMQDMLNDWMLMYRAPEELTEESAIYKKVIKALYSLKYFYYVGLDAIPWDIVCCNLMNVTGTSDFSFGSLFANGISFMKFAPNRTIPVKYLFFLGADADHFPGAPSSNSFDLRKNLRPWPGDDSNTDRNRYAFLCQLMSTSEGFHISYQNKNLVKDSDIYPSPVINDLKNFVKDFANGDVLEIKTTPLDENRNKEDLYTRRSWRYRASAEKLHMRQERSPLKTAPSTSKPAYEKNVSTYQLRKFLEDPFQLYISRTMKIEELGADPMDMTVEPVTLSHLETAIIFKNFVLIQLGVNKEFVDVDSYTTALKNSGQLPHGERFAEQSIAGFKELSSELAEKIKSAYPVESYNYQAKKIDTNIKDKTGTLEFTLQGDIPLYITSKENPKAGYIIDIRGSSIKSHHFVKPYVDALGLIAASEVESVTLDIFSNDGKNDSCCIETKKDKALEIIIELYKLIFVDKERKILPFNLLKTKLESLADLNEKLKGDNGEWMYFAGKDLFDVMQNGVSGYSVDAESFVQEWEVSRINQQRLIAESLLAKIKEG